jgi:hypothetical protein
LTSLGALDGPPNLESPAALSKALATYELAAWQQLPASPREVVEIAHTEHEGVKLCTYARWFDADS